jgi:16S rRNA (uracil1498-N3)-methyltransferase
MYRCLVSPADLDRGRLRLPPGPAHHVGRVLRCAPGDRIELFDGAGRAAAAELEAVTQDEVTARVIEPLSADAAAPAGPRVVLLQALPKGRLMDWIVEKATEIGVDAVIPVLARRSVSRPGEERVGARAERWRRIAEAATRQCGGATVPRIDGPCILGQALDAAGPMDLLLVCCVSPGAESLSHVLSRRFPAAGAVGLMIGPEGDWAPEEVAEAVARGGVAVSLGRRVLRVETAALYALSVVTCAGCPASAPPPAPCQASPA